MPSVEVRPHMCYITHSLYYIEHIMYFQIISANATIYTFLLNVEIRCWVWNVKAWIVDTFKVTEEPLAKQTDALR